MGVGFVFVRVWAMIATSNFYNQKSALVLTILNFYNQFSPMQ